jgi:hypothetical protein
MAGRITINMNATKATPETTTQIDIKDLLCSPPLPLPAKATAKASKIHAATSLKTLLQPLQSLQLELLVALNILQEFGLAEEMLWYKYNH